MGGGASTLPRAARLGLVGLRAVSRGRLEAARETRPGREASRVHLHAIAAAGARGEGLGGGWGGGVLPVNPPSPAFRGVRGLRRTRCRAAGPLAPSLGLHSRRKMTSLNRPAPRSPHTPDAIGSVFYAAMCGFAGLRGVCLRGVFEGCFRFDKTRGLLVIQCVFCAASAPRSTRDTTIQSLRSDFQILLRSFVNQELPSIRRA